MKKLLLSLLLFSNIAHAEIKQVEVKLACDTDHSIVNTLTDKYNEHPLIVGKTADNKMIMILSVNPDNLGWTVLGVQGEMTCIFVAGKDLEIIELKKTKKINYK